MKTALLLALVLAAIPLSTSANVITDWDDIAIKAIYPPNSANPINVPGDLSFRAAALVHLAMFNAVDCIDPKYKPYQMQLEPSPNTSEEAAAASAAANVLMKLIPNNISPRYLMVRPKSVVSRSVRRQPLASSTCGQTMAKQPAMRIALLPSRGNTP
jgi:hypothetical protein